MKKYFFYMMAILMIAMVNVSFTACSSDDDNEATISKSELIGTWYTLEDDWVLVFTETSVTQYEIWKFSGKYSLNSYTVTTKYSLSGNKIIGEDGLNATISINGNTLRVSNGEESLTYTKFNGTPQQLMNYLNN
ncbi:MAG: hypothetical protein J6Z14_09290 [Prevotella sp.]|nr:hypothetical protein [Prevotella sp.]